MSLFSSSTSAHNPAGGSLFGGQSTLQQPASGNSGSLFGSSPQPASLFGSSMQQQHHQPNAGGLFSQPQQSRQQQQHQLTGGGLFGQSQQQQQPQQSSGGLFGNGTTQQGAGRGGLFGTSQASGGGLFGQSQQQNSGGGGGLFGQTVTQQGSNGGLFGGAGPSQFSGSLLGSSSGINPGLMPQQQNVVVEKLSRVKNAWDMSHPDYAFRTYFYNSLGEEQASRVQKAPGEDITAWEKAWAERPNKACAPVSANGFSDLDKRVQVQDRLVQAFRQRLWGMQEKLTSIQNRHDLSTSIKLEDCRRRHQALAKRALTLAANVQVVKNRGYALQPEEEQLKKRLEGLAKVVLDPAVSGRMNEAWARMMVVAEKARVMEEGLGKVEIVWDEKRLQTTGKLLQTNAAGLEFLHKEVREIEKTFAQWEKTQEARPLRNL